jgi:transcription elongation factor Elf1
MNALNPPYGSEYRIKSSNCSACTGQKIEKTTRKKQLITTTSICKQCGHIDRNEIDLSPKPEVIDEHFAEDRSKYCLSTDELAVYREGKANIEQLTKFLRELKIKENTNNETSLPKPQILKVIEVFQLVKNSLEGLRFEQIQMLTPATNDGIRIQFSVLDSDSSRSDAEAANASNDILEKSLKQTNWRLIPKSLKSTLGALNFELKGYT